MIHAKRGRANFMVEDGKPVREVARLLKVHRATLYRELAKAADSSA